MNDQPRLSLKQVRAIDAVARSQSFEQAARVLNTTQPVVSRAVASAEARLGFQLFQRGWGGTEITPHGEAALQHCSRALSLISSAEDELEAATGQRPNLQRFLKWHHLDAVAAVVSFGTASLASDFLEITQPAISRTISALSDFAGRPLFERRRTGLDATPRARRLAELRDELVQVIGNVEDLKQNSNSGLIGRLAVGMLPFSGQDLVAKAFGTLTNMHPKLRLMALPGSYNMLARALRRGEIDCMVGILRNPTHLPELQETFLYEEQFTLIARQEHSCHLKPQSIQTLKSEKWIVGPHGTPVRTYFEYLFKTAGATPPAQTCEILSFSNAERVIMHSNSIGLLTYNNQHLAVLPHELRKVDVELPDPQTAVGLTKRKTGATNEILDIFESILRGYAHTIKTSPSLLAPD